MSADILDGLRAIVRGATEGPCPVDSVDRIPVEMLSHAVAEIAALRDQQPPADLPATLASVDDVARVARAAGLQQFVVFGHRCWTGVVELRAADAHGWSISTPFGIEANWGAPTALLWHAIQAARSAS